MQRQTVQYLSIAFFALLLLWGIYSLLYYLGMPIHAAILLTDAAQQMVNSACPGDQMLCRGVFSFFPFLLHTVGRAEPFLWYAGISVLAYAAFVGWRWFVDESSTFRITWKPWKIYALFLACLWLLFTVLSFGDSNGRPVRQFFEPLAQIYNVSDRGLAALQKDYHDLDARGCLSQQPGEASGARVYTLRQWCIQQAFVERTLTQVVFITVLLFEFLLLGGFLLRRLRVPLSGLFLESVASVALGACAWIVLLWIAAVAGIYISSVGWGLLILVPALCYKEALVWLRRFVSHEWTVEYRWHDVSLLLGWLLLSYIALNFLTVVRPFPIGWDDLGSYLNRPRLLVSYGHFIHSMSPFDWGYLTSLGFLLFGYKSIFGATASMMINWSAGLLSVLGIIAFVRSYLGRKSGLLSALFYYALPMVGHFSFADMKIDNAVFFMGAMAFLFLFLALFPREEAADDPTALPPEAERWKYLLLSGVFVGFAFAMKSTAVMVLMPLGAILLGVLLAWPAAVGVVFLAFLVFFRMGAFSLGSIAARIAGTGVPIDTIGAVFSAVCLLVGLACIAYAVTRNRARAMETVRMTLFLGAGFVIAVLPWIEHNNLLYGRIIPRLELGAPNLLSPTIVTQGTPAPDHSGREVRTLPPELATKADSPACQATGSIEELDRYWGFGKGWGHYLTLPWRAVMNVDSTGYYVTVVPALLLFPLLLLLPHFWTRRARWLRWLCFGTWFLLIEWIFLANGVPWYGIGMFLGLVVALEVMVARAPDVMGRWLAGTLVGLSLLMAFGMRFWQYEQTQNIFEYSFGKVSSDVLQQLTIPYYDPITERVLELHDAHPDRPYLYRVGTFIPYFVPRNLEIIGINDHQLDVFNCLNAERDPALTLQRLKSLGFNSIIFDTNTATIERDPNGSLHKKVQAFQDFVNNPASGMKVVISDAGAGVAFVEIP